MSKKLKKIQIPKCSRDNFNSTESKFFSQNDQIEKSASDSENIKLSISQPENIQLESNEIKENKSISKNKNRNVSNIELDIDATTGGSIQNDCVLKSSETTSNVASSILKRKTSSNNNTIKKFFNDSGADSDFITPPKQKKTFKSSKLNGQQQEKKGGFKTKRKRQPKINNMLLRNEMMYSKMITQQSIAENVNPDDMQLALALSRSEIETNRKSGDRNDECDAKEDSPMNIDKLKRFEYKPTRSNNDHDFNLFIPNKSRGKWANKFTPLTLRNSERQYQKLLENVEKFLSKQEQFSSGINPEKEKLKQKQIITITSDYLKDIVSNDNQIFYKHSSNDDNLNSYYVTDLFTPTIIKAGYLLKDHRKIPGREPSPEPFIINNQFSKDEQQQHQKTDLTETHILDAISSSQTENSERSYYEKAEDETNIPRELSPDLFADYDEIYLEAEVSKTSCEVEMEKTGKEVTDLEDNGKTINTENDLKHSIQIKNNLDSEVMNYNDPEKESDEWSQRLTIEEDTENHEKIEQPLENKNENKFIDNANNDSIKKNDFIDLTEGCSRSSLESDSSIIITGEYKSSENLNFFDISQKSSFKKPLHRSFSAIYSKDEHKSIQNFETNQQKEFDNSSRSSLQKCASEINFHSTLKDESEKYQFTEENYSQNTSVGDCVIILSDDEVNYSIRKTKNKIFESNIDNSEYGSNSKSTLSDDNKSTLIDSDTSEEQKIPDHNFSNIHDFSILDLISEKNQIDLEVDEDDDILNISGQSNREAQLEFDELALVDGSKEQCQDEEFDDSFFNLKKIKAQFGILDERTPIKMKKDKTIVTLEITGHSCRKSLSESFLKPSSSSFVNKKQNETKSFQRFSSNKKFNEFIYEDFNDFDEFDKLVYGSPTKTVAESPKKPLGLEKLLTGDINMTTEEINSRKEEEKEGKRFIEIESGGQIYLVQFENVPEKPDYQNMDLPTLHRELFKYGVKPLKRKQAILILEYIYNQTHPIISDFDLSESDEDQDKKNDCCENQVINRKQLEKESKKKEVSKNKEEKSNNLELKDCFGDVLLRPDEILPEIDNEEYFLPTNMRLKVLTAPLPLHIAWFNLVKSNLKLRESLLHYEPIDLQEIYLFFKKIGYRYNPKDMKKFFDSRCIIFRYDLYEGNNDRHTKKLLPKKKTR